MKQILTGLFVAVLSGLSGAQAQTQDEIVDVFAGAWRVFDFGYVNGGPCTIALSKNTISEFYVAEQAYCGGGLDGIGAWGINGGQLVLMDGGFSPIARLGGTENRISGDMSDGRMVILERTQPGAPEPATPPCLYVGYSQECASGADRTALQVSPGRPVRAEVLVELVLREQPRPDAVPLTQASQGACIAFVECRVASDGPWCAASVQGARVWARQHAVRLGEFPVLTYRAGRSENCSQGAQFLRSE